MSSTDGFCSTLAFAPGELGDVYRGPHPTYNHPTLSSTLPQTSSTGSTPLPTPTATQSPSFAKASPVTIVPPSHPSPAPTFTMRPGSPTRSNSQSSIATLSSMQNSVVGNNPTPTLSNVPLVTAAHSGPPVVVPPMTTPPQTPMSTTGGYHSAQSSVSGNVLGKRDAGAASESEKEDHKAKKRRIAPTLISTANDSPVPNKGETKEEVSKSSG